MKLAEGSVQEILVDLSNEKQQLALMWEKEGTMQWDWCAMLEPDHGTPGSHGKEFGFYAKWAVMEVFIQ